LRRSDSSSLHATIPPPIADRDRPAEEVAGDALLAAAILRGGWDVGRDLVVLVGPAPARAAGALRRLGQERILWLRTGDDEPTEAPAGVLRVDHLDEVAAAVRALGALEPDRVTGRALDPAHAPLCDQVIARIERARRERALCSDPGGGAAAARTRLEQGLANLPALCRWPGAAGVGTSLAGMPMLIAAPGPSLARTIELLPALRGRAVLLALSHAVAPLLRAGITPDFVLAADEHDVSHHLAGLDLSSIGAIIAASTAHPLTFQSGALRHLVLAASGPVDAWLGELAGPDSEAAEAAPPMLSSGGSVAHTALSLALAWGCDPIGFVGLDLSFPGGQCYVNASADGGVHAVASADGRTVSLEGWAAAPEQRRARASERLVELPGWDGRPLPTSFHFSMCQRWFEETARRMAGTVRLYNCSEGGAYIGGMRHIRLAGLASRLPPPAALSPAGVAARAVGQVDPRTRRRVARERLVDVALLLRELQGPRAGETAAPPLLSALVDAEMADAEPRGARSPGEEERRGAALRRWAAWLEPRVVEAERALARQDRAAETLRMRAQAPAAVKSG
jgi:hypothetical protein